MRLQISCLLDQSEDRECSVTSYISWLICFALSFIYLLALREKQLDQQRDLLPAPAAASSPKVRRTYGKTYGRRKNVKESDSRVATPLSDSRVATPLSDSRVATPLSDAGSGVDPSEASSQASSRTRLDLVPPR